LIIKQKDIIITSQVKWERKRWFDCLFDRFSTTGRRFGNSRE